MSTGINQHGDADIHSPKRQKTATSYVAMPANGHDGDNDGNDNDNDGGGKDSKLKKPRAYQLEMLQESLRQNVIIAVS